MIVTDCNIQVNNDKSTADKKIIVYRGDYNVQVTFTITQSNNYRYRGIDSSGENLIESTNASYGQILIKNQDGKGVSVLSEIAPTNEGKVTLTILKEHIDELIELGPYDYQIRLFSAEKEARLTIPPIEGQLIVKEPLIFDSGDDNNIVDEAIVDKAAIIDDGEELPVFDEEGNYIKTEWISGDIITAEKLNKTEDALETLVNESKNHIDADYVDQQIKTIELTPGPKGDKGDPGVQGPKGDKGDTPSLDGYATETYVDNAINNIDIPEVDTSNLATKEELNNALGDISDLLDLFNGDGEVN